MTMLHLLAAGWTWPAVTVVVVFTLSFTLLGIAGMARNFAARPGVAAGSPRLNKMADDLEEIRADLAEIKATLSEIDRVFKSVG